MLDNLSLYVKGIIGERHKLFEVEIDLPRAFNKEKVIKDSLFKVK